MKGHKIIIVLLGASGTGKSTTRKAFFHKKKHVQYRSYVLYEDFATLGTISNGADVFIAIAGVLGSIYSCLYARDIVMFDVIKSVRTIYKHILEQHMPVKFIIVYFNLKRYERYCRLSARSNLKQITHKTWKAHNSFQKKVLKTKKLIENSGRLLETVNIYNQDSTEAIVKKINESVTKHAKTL